MLQYFDETILRDYEEEVIPPEQPVRDQGRYIEAVNNGVCFRTHGSVLLIQHSPSREFKLPPQFEQPKVIDI